MATAGRLGWVKLHRSTAGHALFRGRAGWLGAWCWLLANAAWRPTPFDIAGRLVTLQPGQVCASRSQMAREWGMSESAVERLLTRLKTERLIERETGQGRSIITICNYGAFQAVEADTGQATGQGGGQRPDSDRTAKEEVQEDKTYSEAEASGATVADAPGADDARSTCFRLGIPWLTSTGMTEARARGLVAAMVDEVGAFEVRAAIHSDLMQTWGDGPGEEMLVEEAAAEFVSACRYSADRDPLPADDDDQFTTEDLLKAVAEGLL